MLFKSMQHIESKLYYISLLRNRYNVRHKLKGLEVAHLAHASQTKRFIWATYKKVCRTVDLKINWLCKQKRRRTLNKSQNLFHHNLLPHGLFSHIINTNIQAYICIGTGIFRNFQLYQCVALARALLQNGWLDIAATLRIHYSIFDLFIRWCLLALYQSGVAWLSFYVVWRNPVWANI